MALIVAAAIVRGGRLLSARRSRGPYAGLWEFPGGKVEAGESEQDALARELHEELALASCQVEARIGGAWPLEQGLTMHVYRVSLADGDEPQCRADHDELRWLGRHDAGSVPWIPADLPIVAAVVGTLET